MPAAFNLTFDDGSGAPAVHNGAISAPDLARFYQACRTHYPSVNTNAQAAQAFLLDVTALAKSITLEEEQAAATRNNVNVIQQIAIS